jgi:DNA polymerase-3 subunit epsilon
MTEQGPKPVLPRWIKRRLDLARLKDPSYRYLFEPGPPGEVVAIDCETTGLDPKKDDVIAIAAIGIKNNRIETSKAFQAAIRPEAAMEPAAIKIHRLRHADVAGGRSDEVVIPELLRFIGGRPLVGYYLEFDVAMLNKHMRRLVGFELPNPLIEVSGLYYERKYGDAPPGVHVDLSFAAIMEDLKLPMLDQHDAYSDALMTAMMYLALRDLKQRKKRLTRKPLGAAHPL